MKFGVGAVLRGELGCSQSNQLPSKTSLSVTSPGTSSASAPVPSFSMKSHAPGGPSGLPECNAMVKGRPSDCLPSQDPWKD